VTAEKNKKAAVKIEQIKILTRITVFIVNKATPMAVELADFINVSVSRTGNLIPTKTKIPVSTNRGPINRGSFQERNEHDWRRKCVCGLKVFIFLLL